jgi:prepilin-type N-terminal cleavage/methylation domain-containing protein/prepilin-type processing-associated H-X9-DG protein
MPTYFARNLSGRAALLLDSAPAERIAMFKRRGFTLIEVLVVIGIVALLAAVLFPVYFSTRDRARQTTCMTNMKQLTVMFLQDEDDREIIFPDSFRVGKYKYPWEQNPYPPKEQGAPTGLGFMIKGDALRVLDQLAICPSDFRFKPTDHWSYMANAFVFYGAAMGGRAANPSSTIYLVEASHDPVVPRIEPWWIYDAGTHMRNDAEIALLKSEIAVDRHHGGSNYAFLDGHVKWMHFEQTVEPVSLYDVRNK